MSYNSSDVEWKVIQNVVKVFNRRIRTLICLLKKSWVRVLTASFHDKNQ
jgi:hypothetical protein